MIIPLTPRGRGILRPGSGDGGQDAQLRLERVHRQRRPRIPADMHLALADVRDDASIAGLEGGATAERDELDPFAGPRSTLYSRRQMASAPSVHAVPFGSRWRTQCERFTGGVNRTFGEPCMDQPLRPRTTASARSTSRSSSKVSTPGDSPSRTRSTTPGYRDTINEALCEVARMAALRETATLARTGGLNLVTPDEIVEMRASPLPCCSGPWCLLSIPAPPNS